VRTPSGAVLVCNPPMVGVQSTSESYCRRALPRVSRTFAINIRVLSGVLGDWVRTAYLLCRIADTLEDDWPESRTPVEERFDLLRRALGGESRAAVDLASSVPASVSEDAPALDLVRHAPIVVARLDGFAPGPRGVVAEGVTTLASGMERFARRAPARASRAYVEDDAELHQYCYVVAGCVGEMLTRLYAHTQRNGHDSRLDEMLRLSPAFGEGLQLTNILLDLPVDLPRGRCYVPQSWLEAEGLTRGSLRDAARADSVDRVLGRLESMALAGLDAAQRYTLLIPRSRWRYRLFCAWPSLWALGSIAAARSARAFPFAVARPRLGRAEIGRIARASVSRVLSNRALAALFRRVRPAERMGPLR